MPNSIGSYELLDLLGSGGMGHVYRSRRFGAQDVFAVKVLRPELMSDQSAVARFLQERALMVSLRHDNLVGVVDLVVEEGSAAIVMELVNGGDLRSLITQKSTLSPHQALGIARGVLMALAYVHDRGVVHRDIKPENILVTSDGVPKVTDFGVARITEGQRITKYTGLIGTPDYMSPELGNEGSVVPAGDVYATGVVLFEMLAGSAPFTGGHPVAVLRRHLESPVPELPGLEPEIASLVRDMLEKEPSVRPTASQAAARISAFIESADRNALAPVPVAELIRQTTANPSANRTADTLQTRLEKTQDQPAPETIIIRRSEVTEEPTAVPTSARVSRRSGLAMVFGGVALLLAIVVAIVLLGGSSPRVNKLANKTASYSFKTRYLPGGATISKQTWTMSQSNPRVIQVQFQSSSPKRDETFIQAFSPQLIPLYTQIKIAPGTAKFIVLQADPIIEWKLPLGTAVFKYTLVLTAQQTNHFNDFNSWINTMGRLDGQVKVSKLLRTDEGTTRLHNPPTTTTSKPKRKMHPTSTTTRPATTTTQFVATTTTPHVTTTTRPTTTTTAQPKIKRNTQPTTTTTSKPKRKRKTHPTTTTIRPTTTTTQTVGPPTTTTTIPPTTTSTTRPTTTISTTTTTAPPSSKALYNNMASGAGVAQFCSNGGSATQTFTVPSGAISLTELRIFNDTWSISEPSETESVAVYVNGQNRYNGSVSLPGNTSQEKDFYFNFGVSGGDSVSIVITFNSAVGKIPDLFLSSSNPTGTISYTNSNCSGKASGSSTNPTMYGQVIGMSY